MGESMDFMNEALKEALIAYEKGDVPVGCVIVKDGVIIGRGHNEKESSNDATSHGEINAIKEACKNLNSWYLVDCDMYVNLEPCCMCAGAIIMSRIRKVYIGAENLRTGACGSVLNLLNMKEFNHKSEVEFVNDKLSSYIVSRFFKNLRRKSNDTKKANKEEKEA